MPQVHCHTYHFYTDKIPTCKWKIGFAADLGGREQRVAGSRKWRCDLLLHAHRRKKPIKLRLEHTNIRFRPVKKRNTLRLQFKAASNLQNRTQCVALAWLIIITTGIITQPLKGYLKPLFGVEYLFQRWYSFYLHFTKKERMKKKQGR